MEISQTTQAVAQTIDCSPETDSKALLLKTAPTPLIENEDVWLVPTENLHPYALVSLVREGTLQATKSGMETPTQGQTHCLQNMTGYNSCGSNQLISGLT